MPVRDRMKVLKRILSRIIIGANIISAFFLLACGWSTELYPADFPRLSLLGMSFPFLLLLNLFFVAFWLVFSIRRVWIPIVGLLISWPYIHDYCPINWCSDVPEGAIKVMTYNNEQYGRQENDENGRNPVLDYMVHSGADIICIQEGVTSGKLTTRRVDKEMRAAGYQVCRYNDHIVGHQTVFSKLPVLSVKKIPYKSKSNGSVAVELLHEDDTVLLVNNHFESYKLTAQDKKEYKEVLNDPESEVAGSNTRKLIRKMARANKIRGPQVDSVLYYINKVGRDGVIVCGDFNDTPISYSCNRMASEYINVFGESGNGLGWTYNQSGFNFRIDHIFISEYWQSYGTYVDQSAVWADHYPLITYLKKRKKQH